MKKLVLGSLLGACLMYTFTACSNDNDTEEKGRGRSEARISSFQDSKGYTYNQFIYDNEGRLTSVTVTSTDTHSGTSTEKFTIDYFLSSIRTSEGTTYTITDGRITHLEEQPYRGNNYSKYDFTYDREGQLTLVEENQYNNENLIRTSRTRIQWQNGYITSLENGGYTQTFVYTDIPSNNFFPMEDLEACMPLIDGVQPYLFSKGYFGKYPGNVVKTCTVSGNERSYTYTYTYKRDNKGNIVEVEEDDSYKSGSDRKYNCKYTWE